MSDELTILRTSIKRVAEMTQDAQVITAIPEGDELNAHPYSKQGWNRLCVVLCDWIENHRVVEPSLVPDDDPDACTNPKGHEWAYTGTEYGGDDESYHGEGRCYCIHCGNDGDA